MLTKTRVSAAVVGDFKTTYVWDQRNRLSSVAIASNDANQDTLTMYFVYDAVDRRVAKTTIATGIVGSPVVTSPTVDFVYHGSQLLYTYDPGANSILARFLPRPDGQAFAEDVTVAEVVDGVSVPAGPRWLLADREGSVRRVVDAHGVKLGDVSYDAYGNITSTLTPAAAGSIACWRRST